jgi:hypothetical protein
MSGFLKVLLVSSYRIRKMKKVKTLRTLCFVHFALCFCYNGVAQDNHPFVLDVPYVPTPEIVVDKMLQLAEVSNDDILYDLGSGDGRIPIAAAQRFGTVGIGIDLNPERVREANMNAQNAEVTNKVKFIEGNIFDLDFSEATVLCLYLFPEVNLKLRPRILQMKPGTRVVSHNYHMGDWKPEQTEKIKAPNGTEHTLYLWRVPPNGDINTTH